MESEEKHYKSRPLSHDYTFLWACWHSNLLNQAHIYYINGSNTLAVNRMSN